MARELPVGRRQQRGTSKPLHLPLNALLRHCWVTGCSGWGKSGFLISILCALVSRREGVGVVLVDLKGETAQELRDRFLPAMAERYPHIDPHALVTVEPFGPYGVPLGLLAPSKLAAEVQASLLSSTLASVVEGFGQRMLGVCSWLIRAGLHARLNLVEVVRLVVDDAFRQQVAGRISDPVVARYLRDELKMEPSSTLLALKSRLEWVTLVPQLRAQLCAPRRLEGPDLLEAPITIIDLSGAPQGFVPLSRFAGSILLQSITAAVMDRPVDQKTRPVLLCIDEWQELLAGSGAVDDLARLLALARHKRVGLWLINQSAHQISKVSPALLEILRDNLSLRVAFRPDPTDLKGALPLLPVTGRRPDPDQPDKLLSRTEEQRRILATLSALPPREMVFANYLVGKAHRLRTLSLPYEEAARRAAALAPETRAQFRCGRFGRPIDQMIAALEEHPPDVQAPANGKGRRRRRSPRPKLELP